VHLDDLSALPDEDLYDLEGRRSLEPAEWRRVDDELRRRRRSRIPGYGTSIGLADMPETTPVPQITLGDLERVQSTILSRLTATEQRVRRLKWWVVLTPVMWALAAAAGVYAARVFAL
jgi:hypothetical protein